VDIQPNRFKAALAAGERPLGLWSSLCSNIVADLLSDSGFDWILLDTEHSPNELPGLLTQMQALSRGTTSAIVRPAWNDPVLIKRVLDIGAQSVLIPFVQNAEEAARAVAACRYPPAGIRGITTSGRGARYGRVADYLHTANREICVLVQVETGAALDQLEAIAAVEGIDGVFIGPADLSASLGHIGNPLHPEVQRAIEDAGRRLKAVGKPPAS
jgi:4-hydroxy-2-oxoheptanedioate aldolase